MKAYELVINMSSRSLDDCYTFIHDADNHIGSKNADEDLQIKVVKRIKEDPQCWWFNTGDTCEFIQRNDPRFETGNVPSWFDFKMMSDPVRHQIRRFVDIHKPVSDRCVGSVFGNHEFALMKYNSRNVYSDLWDEMELPEERKLGINGFIRLKFMYLDKVYWKQDIYLHHGSASGRMKASAVTELEKLPMGVKADIYCIGHSHKKIAFSDEYSAMDSVTNRVVRRMRYYSSGGSYVKGISENEDGVWAERVGLYPQAVGPVEIKIYPNRKEVKLLT
jgi:hypothetical protein